MKLLTKEDVEKHNKKNDCWIIINYKVYNLTNFMKNHPGGYDPMQIAGGDATHLFYSLHPNIVKNLINSESFIQKYYVGEIKTKCKNNFDHNTIFYNTLRDDVENELLKKNIPLRDNFLYKIYNIFIIFLFFVCYNFVFNKKTSNIYLMFLMIMLDFMISVGIAHEAHHGAILKPKFYRWFIKYISLVTINGGWSFYWMWDHNVLHHGYTNEKEDLNKYYSKSLRLSKYLPKMQIHKYQHLFAWFGYSVGLLYSKITIDFWELTTIKTSFEDKLNHIVFKSIWYYLFWIHPIKNFGIGKLFICIIYQLLAGLYFTTLKIENEFPRSKTTDWAKHEIITSSNYNSGNIVINLLTGGLNHQIEHHLFPSFSHHTYPIIHKIVKQKCVENNILYNNYKTVFHAIYQHYQYLKKMGT